MLLFIADVPNNVFISLNNVDAYNDDIQSKIYYPENIIPKKVLDLKLKGKF
jgi:hypothetical protein